MGIKVAETRVIFKRNSRLVVSAENKNLVLFWKIINFYIYDLVDNDTINNSGRYFPCGVCNLKKI